MTACRLVDLVMALVIVPAAIGKLITFRRTARQFSEYLGVAARLGAPLTAALIVLELSIATALVSRPDATVATLAGGLLFSTFVVADRTRARREVGSTPRSCGCLGAGIDLRPGMTSAVLNAAVASSAFACIAADRFFGADVDTPSAWPVTLAAALLAAVYWVTLHAASVLARITAIPHAAGESVVSS